MARFWPSAVRMTGWLADLRIALRLLRRRPGWTASVLATLALAIGANSALFSVLDAALLQPHAVSRRPNAWCSSGETRAVVRARCR